MKNTETSYKVPICCVITCYGKQQICQTSGGLTFGDPGDPGAPYQEGGEYNL